MKQPMIDTMVNGAYDELYTPEYAIKPLLKYIPKNAVVWECTDYGSSNISKVILENGHKVITTHLNTNLDFLTDMPDFDFDIIITNPPYSLKDDFIRKCYELGKPFALLLPLTALEGIKRGEMFEKNGIELLVLDKRVDFTGKKSCWFNTSWFCKGLLPRQMIFEKISKEEV